MSIGKVNDYSSILQNYKIPVISDYAPIVASDVQKQENPVFTPVADIHEKASVSAPIRRDAKLENISFTFNKQEDFGYIGKDSDIRSLDMEKAISDMKKDQVLQQYQYFVGSAGKMVTDNADGVVLAKF